MKDGSTPEADGAPSFPPARPWEEADPSPSFPRRARFLHAFADKWAPAPSEGSGRGLKGGVPWASSPGGWGPRVPPVPRPAPVRASGRLDGLSGSATPKQRAGGGRSHWTTGVGGGRARRAAGGPSP